MLNLVIAGLLLPLVSSILLFRRPRKPAGGWIATFVLAAGMTAFGYFAVPWGFLGMPLRYAVAALFLAALTVSLLRRPDDRADDAPTRILLKVLIGFFIGSVALGVLRANSKPEGTRDVAFPLSRGRYAVIHGGSTTAANTYFGRGAEGWAVDVVKAGGPIANEIVVSPCDGTVVSPKPLRLRCGDLTVDLAEAEATVKGTVGRGAVVGRVTGSHLHVFAQRNGQPVPLTFDGKWLVRNAVVTR
jgi:hypothetical protein